MAWTIWAFQLKDDKWSRVPWKWYERFTAGKTPVEEPEGTILRFALVSVELDDREPERAKYPSFVVHEVAENGLINLERENQAKSAGVEAVFGALIARDRSDNVIPASAKFARRQHENLARWTPTPEQNEALLRLLRSLLPRQFSSVNPEFDSRRHRKWPQRQIATRVALHESWIAL